MRVSALRPSVSRSQRAHSFQANRWFRPQFESLESRCLLSITPAEVLGRHVFYDHSRYDGNVSGVNAGDDAAIATDKSALLPGGAATFDNITSYNRGINGLMIDISGSHPEITAGDFEFWVGNSNTPQSWSPAPAPIIITVRGDAGIAGSDRVEILWADGAIKKQWLQVIVHANERTGLAQSDVFYFGNAVGDSSLGNTATHATVNTTDELGARNNPQSVFNNIPLTNRFDYNRDGAVNTSDGLLARNNPTGIGNAVRMISPPTISPPVLGADLANDTAPGGGTNSDGITYDPTVSGTLTSATAIVGLSASMNGGPAMDITSLLEPGGSFTIDVGTLETIYGDALIDQTYTLWLEATDADGLTAAVGIDFTLKLLLDGPSTPDLIAADDTGASNSDNLTKINTPRVDVVAETGSTVRLYVDNVLVDTQVGAPGLQFTLAPISEGPHSLKVTSEDAAGNLAESGTLVIQISTVAPVVAASTIASYTDDLTPHVTVTAAGPVVLTNGTQVVLDVDLNNDGDFDDAGELGRTLSTLFNNKSVFQLTPALDPTDPVDGAYLVQVRARVTDAAGNEGISPLHSLQVDTLGSDALANYLSVVDPSYTYSVARTVVGSGYTYYVLDMTSQTWRSAADVDKPNWRHWVELVVPNGAIGSTALLFVTGGSNNFGSPPSTPDATLLQAALATQTVTVLLRQVPSEPLKFTDEAFTRNEDEIIAYTFDKYVNNLGDPGNESWPLLLAMAKSAVRAMDSVQTFVPSVKPGSQINDFVVTGYSKRGWTTWLSAAGDDRVRAIIPGVIDVLNMDEQMIHHYAHYGFFSPAIHDYEDLDILQNIQMDANRDLGRIVDPYSYLNNGRFDDMPKLIINSTGDEFFVPDSSKYYFSDLPGTQNYLRYIPNTGHGLNSSAGTSTLSFYDAIVNNRTLPTYSWSVGQDGAITVTTPSGSASNVVMWQATNPTSRDFRNAYTGITWTSSPLTNQGSGGTAVYVANPAMPASGARAYFIQLTFPSAIPGNPYVFTTQVNIKTNLAYTPWAFYTATNDPPLAMALAGSENATFGEGFDASGVAFALSLAKPTNEPPAAGIVMAPVAAEPAAVAEAAEAALASWLSEDAGWSNGDDALDEESEELELALDELV